MYFQKHKKENIVLITHLNNDSENYSAFLTDTCMSLCNKLVFSTYVTKENYIIVVITRMFDTIN